MIATNGKQTTPEERVSRPLEKPAANPGNKQRRTVIKQLAIGTAALAGCSILPDKWTVPLLEFGVLPAHATTSGAVVENSTAPAEKSVQAAPSSPSPSAAQSSAAVSGTDDFNLIFKMTEQTCASCGIWFDSAELVVEHSEGTFSSFQSGSLLIKKSSNKQGRFRADLSSIPASATIESAVLNMRLNAHEGIAASDSGGVIKVYDANTGDFVRTITAGGDIKGKGYSKSNPVVPLDFTEYARIVHGQ